MIQCPGCSNSLPDWTQKCQFCGRDVAKVPRPVAPAKQAYVKPVNTWIMTAYYGVAIWYIIGGMRQIGSVLLPKKKDAFEMMFNLDTISLIFGAITIVVGLGLLFKVEIIRNIVVFFAGLAVILGIISLFFIVPGTLVTGWIGFVAMIFTLVDIAANALMIYLIGETATQSPNI